MIEAGAVTAGLLGEGDLLLVLAAVLVVVGAGMGLFTRKGSGIEEHPRGPENR